jgi:L-lactate dehydrogenase complex protein LldF
MKPVAEDFHAAADQALANVRLQRSLETATSRFSIQRLAAATERADWENLRRTGRAIRWEAVEHLDRYLQQLEAKIVEQGGVVHWARDGAEACAIVSQIAQRRGVRLAVKSKSMATEEINLNHALEEIGVEPIETDLGEYIIQLAGETPSHLLAPAIHRSKEEIARLFVEKLGVPYTEDVAELTQTARRTLRKRFLTATMGISGANFGVAETGTLVVVENEGNARLTTSAPAVHVAIMGIEKVIPKLQDLETLLTLLPRSATGQRMSSYVSLLNGKRRPGETDGPEEFHLVLLDNGRSGILADPETRESLICIRCAACLAACPVYRRAGGHAYGWVYQGPIGAVITPQLLGPAQAAPLPFASSLCGACRDACPVKIDLPRMLLHLREKVVEEVQQPQSVWTTIGVRLAAWIMASPTRFALAGRAAYHGQRFAEALGIARLLPGPMAAWARQRAVPHLAATPLRKRRPR